MEGEMGTGARIAIALIVLGVLISVVFTILGFTRNTTNQGITTVQNSLESMQLAVFDDYDQQIQSGTQVLSALKLFEGRPVALVVKTIAQMDADGVNSGHNYGAILENTNIATYVNNTIEKNPGESWYIRDIDVSASGSISYNMNYLPAKQTGQDPFIRPTAKFLAELIKDSTGTIVGICFTQQ